MLLILINILIGNAFADPNYEVADAVSGLTKDKACFLNAKSKIKRVCYPDRGGEGLLLPFPSLDLPGTQSSGLKEAGRTFLRRYIKKADFSKKETYTQLANFIYESDPDTTADNSKIDLHLSPFESEVAQQCEYQLLAQFQSGKPFGIDLSWAKAIVFADRAYPEQDPDDFTKPKVLLNALGKKNNTAVTLVIPDRIECSGVGSLIQDLTDVSNRMRRLEAQRQKDPTFAMILENAANDVSSISEIVDTTAAPRLPCAVDVRPFVHNKQKKTHQRQAKIKESSKPVPESSNSALAAKGIQVSEDGITCKGRKEKINPVDLYTEAMSKIGGLRGDELKEEIANASDEAASKFAEMCGVDEEDLGTAEEEYYKKKQEKLDRLAREEWAANGSPKDVTYSVLIRESDNKKIVSQTELVSGCETSDGLSYSCKTLEAETDQELEALRPKNLDGEPLTDEELEDGDFAWNEDDARERAERNAKSKRNGVPPI